MEILIAAVALGLTVLHFFLLMRIGDKAQLLLHRATEINHQLTQLRQENARQRQDIAERISSAPKDLTHSD